MNKIVVDSKLVKNRMLTLQNDTTLTLQKETEIYIIIKKDLTLEIECDSQVKLHVLNQNHQLRMNINLEENADFSGSISIVSNKKIKNEITIHHHFPKTKSKMNCHGLTYENGEINLSVTGVVPKNVTGCICNQSSQIINLNQGKSTIRPNLLIDEYDVTANHASYIGDYQKEKVFYLQTKGLTKEIIYQVLSIAFLKQDSKEEDYNETINQMIHQIF